MARVLQMYVWNAFSHMIPHLRGVMLQETMISEVLQMIIKHDIVFTVYCTHKEILNNRPVLVPMANDKWSV